MPNARISIVLWALARSASADVSLPIAADPPGRGWSCPTRLARGIRCAGDRCVIPRRALDDALEHTSRLATCARIVPSLTDGRPQGFKLYAIRPGSIFERLLLRNGDRLRTINGFELSSPDKALEVYTRLHAADRMVVEIERSGRPMVLTYWIR